MNTEYEIIEGLKAGYEEAYKYIYDRQYKTLCGDKCTKIC